MRYVSLLHGMMHPTVAQVLGDSHGTGSQRCKLCGRLSQRSRAPRSGLVEDARSRYSANHIAILVTRAAVDIHAWLEDGRDPSRDLKANLLAFSCRYRSGVL